MPLWDVSDFMSSSVLSSELWMYMFEVAQFWTVQFFMVMFVPCSDVLEIYMPYFPVPLQSIVYPLPSRVTSSAFISMQFVAVELIMSEVSL